MKDPRKLLSNVDLLLRCLADCEINVDGEIVTIQVSKYSNPWHMYRVDTAKATYDALRELQEMERSKK